MKKRISPKSFKPLGRLVLSLLNKDKANLPPLKKLFWEVLGTIPIEKPEKVKSFQNFIPHLFLKLFELYGKGEIAFQKYYQQDCLAFELDKGKTGGVDGWFVCQSSKNTGFSAEGEKPLSFEINYLPEESQKGNSNLKFCVKTDIVHPGFDYEGPKFQGKIGVGQIPITEKFLDQVLRSEIFHLEERFNTEIQKLKAKKSEGARP